MVQEATIADLAKSGFGIEAAHFVSRSMIASELSLVAPLADKSQDS